jgi:two-component system chemotaxis response regulator CheB
MSEKVKVLIVDDATFMRKALAQILELDPGLEIVGSAKNGLDALGKVRTLRPDIITLDIDMPIMDGLTAIKHIMIEMPIPIVVLSSLIHDGSITFEALRLGVVDFIPKPSGAISQNIDRIRHQIIDRIKVAHKVKLENLRRVRLPIREMQKKKLEETMRLQPPEYIVVLGTALSGPNTIIRLISQLSNALPTSIVVVQEISPKILPSFVERFNQFVTWKVEVVQNDMRLEQGTCYICSNEYSLALTLNKKGEACFRLSDGIHHPLDLLFSSAATIFHEKTVGVLLTGLGDDGAEGFARIQQAQGVTIVEDTQCCVYPNLVHNAIQHDVVDHILHESSLPRAIESFMVQDSVLPGHMSCPLEGIEKNALSNFKGDISI